MQTYQDFLEQKTFRDLSAGFQREIINQHLFDFQRTITAWALSKGRAAIFADTGLGKTRMQVEWAHHVHNHTNGKVIILAPLCVAIQTVHEAAKMNIAVNYCRSMEGVKDGINITNYEMMEHFDMSAFAGVVLDESSILKSIDGKTKTALIERCAAIPYRLSCTATPSPNDYMELGNQAEFLGVMSSVEMLAMFFTHDGGETSKWRLKKHGEMKFWEWMSKWAVCIRKPSDIGFADDGYILPEMKIRKHITETDYKSESLFPVLEDGIRGRLNARRSSLAHRINKVVELVRDSSEQFIVWCELNAESDELEKAIEGAKAVKGSDSLEKKESTIQSFLSGELRVIISKASIMGYGLNLQFCNRMVFAGITDSWESYYQAVRRCHRFGQKKSVIVDMVYSQPEDEIMQNLIRKEKQHSVMGNKMAEVMQRFTKSEINKTKKEKAVYKMKQKEGDGWKLILGDCVDVLSKQPEKSIDYSIFSPPFASLYTYSNSDRDMGNCLDDTQFHNHFQFLIKELARVMKAGRLVSFHCMNLPTTKTRDGFIGIKDFRGELIRNFQKEGFVFHSEVCIWKDPVTAMQRTKAIGLLHKQIKKDSTVSRQGIADYLVTMKALGDNENPVSHTNGTFPVDVWQKYASPVWMDINPSDTLQFRTARANDDERHICPLQLGVIQRGIELWSNPGELILSPFAGIGSEGYVSLQMGREFLGIELKASYFDLACRNLEEATRQRTLFESDLEIAVNK